MEPIEYIFFFIKVMLKALIGKAIDMLFKLFLSMALPTNLEDMEQDVDTAEEDVDTAEEVGSVSVSVSKAIDKKRLNSMSMALPIKALTITLMKNMMYLMGSMAVLQTV